MKRKKENRGGARAGSGRKALSGVKIKKSVSVTAEHEKAILTHYAAKNLSRAIEKIAVGLNTTT